MSLFFSAARLRRRRDCREPAGRACRPLPYTLAFRSVVVARVSAGMPADVRCVDVGACAPGLGDPVVETSCLGVSVAIFFCALL